MFFFKRNGLAGNFIVSFKLLAVSSLKCNTLLKVHNFTRKYFSWGLKVEAFTRAVVELSGNCVEVALRELRQIQTLGKILADQTVGILVGRPLPGAVGVRKTDADLDAFGQNLINARAIIAESSETSRF